MSDSSQRHSPILTLGTLTIMDQVLVSGTRFLTTILVGKFCGASGLGCYAVGFTFLLIGNCLVESILAKPFNVFVHRHSAARQKIYEFSNLLQLAFMGLLFSSIAGLAAWLMSLHPGLRTYSTTIAAAAIAIPCSLSWEYSRRVCYARLNVLGAISIDLTMGSLQIASLLLFLYAGVFSPATTYLAIGFACGVATAVWMVPELRKLEWVARARVRAFWLKNFVFGRWLALGQVTGALHPAAVVWSLAAYCGERQAGIYTAAETIVMLSNPLFLAAGSITAPLFAKTYAKQGIAPFKKQVYQCMMVATAGSFVFVFGVGTLSEWLLRLFFREEFQGNGIVVWVLATGILFWILSMLSDSALAAINQPRDTFVARLAGLIVTLAAVMPCMRYWGPAGGAASLVLGSAVTTCMQMMKLNFYLNQNATEPAPADASTMTRSAHLKSLEC